MRTENAIGEAPESDRDAVLADAPSEVTSGRLVRNTIVNGGANAVGAIVTAILTPFLLHRLGPQEYGLWLLALGVTFTNGYLNLADLGFGEASVKQIAEARAAGDGEQVSIVASSTTAIFVAIGLALGGALALGSSAIVAVFDVAPALESTARVLFALMALEIVIELPAAALRAVIEGSQDHARLRVIDAAGRLLWGGLAVTVVARGHGVLGLAVASLSIAVVRSMLTVRAAKRVHPGLRVSPRLVRRATVRATASYGSFVGGLRLLSVIYGQMDRVILGVVVGVAAVAAYEVVFRVQSLAVLVLTLASPIVMPAAAYNAARADLHKQRELFLRGTRYGIAVAVPVIVAAMMFAEPLLRAWVGEEYAHLAGTAQLFLVFSLLATANQVGIPMLIGHGRVRRVLALQTVSVGVNLAVSLALVDRYGVKGVVVGTLAGGVVVWLPYLRELLATFDATASEWFSRCVRPVLVPTAVQLALGAAALRVMGGTGNLVVVLAVIGIGCASSLAAFAAWGMPTGERAHMAAALRRAVSR